MAHAAHAPGPSVGTPPRYQLLGRIGSGGMASVYLGVPEGDVDGEHLVAIKIIHEHLVENRMFVHMLLDEAHLAQRISHENVVGIMDMGEFRKRHFVVMPYIEGGPLSELARKKEGKLPVGHVARIVIDALTGLHAAHALVDERGKPLRIVHRDVSPGNILVGTDGKARVIDFGVAKAASRMTKTAPGTVKGKFSYMAPEQALGEKVDHRADVFSAGVVLWTMLTGQRLFTGDSSAHTIRNLMNAEVPPPSRVRPQVPKCFDEVCSRALERSRDKRYQSAAEMAEELYTAAIIAQTLSPAEEVGRWVEETLITRLTRRREVVAQQRGQKRKNFQLDVADLDRESIQTATPVTPGGQGQAAAAVEGAAPGPAAPRARRWGLILLWTLTVLAVLAAAAVALRDRLPALLQRTGTAPAREAVRTNTGAGPAIVPRPRGTAEPPGSSAAGITPADPGAPVVPVVIEQPVVIPVPGKGKAGARHRNDEADGEDGTAAGTKATRPTANAGVADTARPEAPGDRAQDER